LGRRPLAKNWLAAAILSHMSDKDVSKNSPKGKQGQGQDEARSDGGLFAQYRRALFV